MTVTNVHLSYFCLATPQVNAGGDRQQQDIGHELRRNRNGPLRRNFPGIRIKQTSSMVSLASEISIATPFWAWPCFFPQHLRSIMQSIHHQNGNYWRLGNLPDSDETWMIRKQSGKMYPLSVPSSRPGSGRLESSISWSGLHKTNYEQQQQQQQMSRTGLQSKIIHSTRIFSYRRRYTSARGCCSFLHLHCFSRPVGLHYQ